MKTLLYANTTKDAILLKIHNQKQLVVFCLYAIIQAMIILLTQGLFPLPEKQHLQANFVSDKGHPKMKYILIERKMKNRPRK